MEDRWIEVSSEERGQLQVLCAIVPEKGTRTCSSDVEAAMQTPVVLPEMGLEPGTEMVVSLWFAEEGEEVLEGDRLVEILAGSVTFDVPAPATGRLVEIRAAEDDILRSGHILGIVEADDEPAPD